MKHKSEIEATLHRSLRAQVSVPKLDDRFDASVWARIAAEESRAAATPRVSAQVPWAARCLHIVNVVGLASVGIFIGVFGARMLADVDAASFIPEISAQQGERIVNAISFGISGASLVFGLMFTPWGRRLRDELS